MIPRINYPLLFREMFGGKHDFDNLTDVTTFRQKSIFRDPAPDWEERLNDPTAIHDWSGPDVLVLDNLAHPDLLHGDIPHQHVLGQGERTVIGFPDHQNPANPSLSPTGRDAQRTVHRTDPAPSTDHS